MDRSLVILLLTLLALPSFYAAGHAVLYKRDPRSALGWMSICLTLPLVGPLLYWCLGINRIVRRARSWHRSGRRVPGTDLYPLPETEHAELPPEAAHLRDLRLLGDRIVTTPLRGGNSIVPLHDGEEAYPAMLEAIDRASETVNLCSYIFDADGIGVQFVSRLEAAAGRGVAVRIIIDALGERYSRVPIPTALAGSSVRVERFLPLSNGGYINLRNHRKSLIIDGRVAFTGGMNIRSRHLPTITPEQDAVHDIHFRVGGPVVNDIQSAFLEDWYFITGERLQAPHFFPAVPPQGESLARCVSDGPDRQFRKLEQIILGALACAKRSVRIMTPYFVPDRPMTSALITAALRGIDLTVVLPRRNNLPYVHWANSFILAELLANGVRVFYQPGPFVHSKLFLVDDVWSLVGSTNLDSRSLRLNFEMDLSVFDGAFARRMCRHFDEAVRRSEELSLEELNARPLPVRLRDNLVRLLSPYL